jgi:predicted kinase
MDYQLVVVSGLPASGKSSLSDRLGFDLGLPVIHRDQLRRSVFEPFTEIADAQDRISEATGRMIIEILDTFARARASVILDGNFNTPAHVIPVRALVQDYEWDAIEICLWGDPDILRTRFIERADPPLTDDLIPYFERVLHRPREPVLPSSARIFHLDTTDFSDLDAAYPQLLSALRDERSRVDRS